MTNISLYQSINDSLVSYDFLTAEQLSIEAIKKNNIDAQLWIYLAKALALQGFGNSAKKILERARLLNPQAIWIDQVKNDIEKNNKGLERFDIDEILKVNNVSVCAVIIVKHEEVFIENCVAHLINEIDEVVIVNTRPSDMIVEVKKSFEKIKVIEFECHDDYSAARNAAIPYIKSDWAFFMDADEYIFEDDIDSVCLAASLFDSLNIPILLKVGIVDKIGYGINTTSYDAIRLFPVKYGLRYTSKLYDEVYIDNKMLANATIASYPVRIRLTRFGYMKPENEIKEKLKRNIRLINELVEGGLNDPLLFLFIGRDLYLSGRFSLSIAYFDKCIEQAKSVPSFQKILDAYIFLTKAYIQLEKYVEAEATCTKAINIRNDLSDIQYLYGLIKFKKACNYFKLAEEYVTKSKQSFDTYRSIVSPDSSIYDWKAELLHADITLFTGNLKDAKALYEKAFLTSPSTVKELITKKLAYIKEEIIKVSKISDKLINNA